MSAGRLGTVLAPKRTPFGESWRRQMKETARQAAGEEVVARRILEYWIAHPRAKETAYGIYLAWLGEEIPPATVQAALRYLAERQWVTVRPPLREDIYGLDQTHLAEIHVFLGPARDEGAE